MAIPIQDIKEIDKSIERVLEKRKILIERSLKSNILAAFREVAADAWQLGADHVAEHPGVKDWRQSFLEDD